MPLRLGRHPEQSRYALMRLGERESGTGELEEAMAAFREALKENRASTYHSIGR